MSGHEHHEETKLYPFLCLKFGVNLDFLEEEHEQLHVESEKILDLTTEIMSLQALKEPDRLAVELARLKKRLIDQCFEYDRLLRVHLFEEENLVVPMLLEVTANELEMYHSYDISELTKMIKAGTIPRGN